MTCTVSTAIAASRAAWAEANTFEVTTLAAARAEEERLRAVLPHVERSFLNVFENTVVMTTADPEMVNIAKRAVKIDETEKGALRPREERLRRRLSDHSRDCRAIVAASILRERAIERAACLKAALLESDRLGEVASNLEIEVFFVRPDNLAELELKIAFAIEREITDDWVASQFLADVRHLQGFPAVPSKGAKS